MYKHSIFNFDDKEIDQIVEMVKFSFHGNSNGFIDINGAIDRRKVSKEVFKWAKNYNLIAQGKDIVDWQGKQPHWVKSKARWYIYTRCGDMPFDTFYNAPVEAIWRIVQPILETSKGFYSIISNKGWLDLAVYYRGSREWDRVNEARKEYYNDNRTFGETTHLPKMYQYLALLARHNYIIFQHAGDIWRIEITEHKAQRGDW